jgi:hypothetical protein
MKTLRRKIGPYVLGFSDEYEIPDPVDREKVLDRVRSVLRPKHMGRAYDGAHTFTNFDPGTRLPVLVGAWEVHVYFQESRLLIRHHVRKLAGIRLFPFMFERQLTRMALESKGEQGVDLNT